MVTLESNKLLSQLAEAELSVLRSSVREVRFAPGQVIFKEGDVGDGIYLVKSGLVGISAMLGTSERRLFSRVGPGEFFGEMAVIDSEPRSATATAEMETELYFLPRTELLQLVERSPRIAFVLLREISQKLREFNRHYVREVLQAERLAIIGRFARSIVHDLKNPLNIIGIASELACSADVSLEMRQLTRDRIHKQIDRILALVNEILEFTHHSSPSTVLALGNYGQFVEQLIQEVRPEVALKAVEIELESPPPDVQLHLNPKRLSRVFYNLLHNAMEAMPSGGKIILRFFTTPREVITEVQDSGKGIAPEVEQTLFEAFVTYGKTHGTGMGLSICKKIVEDHRGSISARNHPEGGAIFSFTLPIPSPTGK